MRRSIARFSEPEASDHTPSLADFITTTPELKFSVHTGQKLCSVRQHTMRSALWVADNGRSDGDMQKGRLATSGNRCCTAASAKLVVGGRQQRLLDHRVHEAELLAFVFPQWTQAVRLGFGRFSRDREIECPQPQRRVRRGRDDMRAVRREELSPNFGDGRAGQAAAVMG